MVSLTAVEAALCSSVGLYSQLAFLSMVRGHVCEVVQGNANGVGIMIMHPWVQLHLSAGTC
jgi:hypothetical protein